MPDLLEIQRTARNYLERAWQFYEDAPPRKRKLCAIYVGHFSNVYEQIKAVADKHYDNRFSREKTAPTEPSAELVRMLMQELDVVEHIHQHPEYPSSVYRRYDQINSMFLENLGDEYNRAVGLMFEEAKRISREAGVRMPNDV